jgi:hypothetical protein
VLVREPRAGHTTQLRAVVVSAVLTALDRCAAPPPGFLHFFSAVAVGEFDVARSRKHFGIERGNAAVRYRVPTLFDFTQSEFFEFRPPFFTRAFFRAIVSDIAPPPPADHAVVGLLTPVHAALAYAGVPTLPIVGGGPLSLLRLGHFSPELGALLRVDLRSCSAEALEIFETLMRMEEGELKLAVPWIHTCGGRDAVVTAIVASATGVAADVEFAGRAMAVVERCCEVEVLIPIICGAEFLNQPNFPCVVYIFRELRRLLKEQNKKDFVSFMRLFRNLERGIFKSVFRQKVFKRLRNQDAVARALHEPE